MPRHDVVLYVMNHRSNADYVIVAYVLARVVSISYAVGRMGPDLAARIHLQELRQLFHPPPISGATLPRGAGALCPAHHPERRNPGDLPGGWPYPGWALRPAKVGLIDYMVRTLEDRDFDRDIWLIPVGINYDRVLEDRSLIREGIVGGRAPSRLRQLGGVARYIFWNCARLVTGRLRRYGRAAVNFGTPISVRQWLATQPDDVFTLPRYERLDRIQQLADLAMERIGAVVPVTPVPLAAVALLSFGSSVVPRDRLLERMDNLRDQLGELNAKVVRSELPIAEVWDRAWRCFT